MTRTTNVMCTTRGIQTLWRAILLSVLMALPMSGCLGAGPSGQEPEPAELLSREEIEARLSQPRFDGIAREEAFVVGANGTRVWVSVFRPAGAAEPLPAILHMTPYGFFVDASTECASLPRDECPPDPGLVAFFVPRGYAVAFADVRGYRNSEGCPDREGPESWEDGYHVVEWLAAQPWSNGRVGMHGGSYDADMQVGTAILDPPHLATIVPTAALSNLYGFYYYDGIPYGAPPAETAVFTGLSAWPGSRFDPAGYPERLACQPRHPVEAASADWSPYWAERDFRPHASRIRASVLQVHGLLDQTVRTDHLDGFWNNLTSEKRLVLGQWGHGFPDRPDWLLIRHRWFDHFLLGTDTGILEDLPPVLVEDPTGAWRGIASYPPLEAETLKLYLHPDGTLAPEPPAPGTLTIQDYPRASFEGVGGAVLSAPGEAVTGNPRRLAFETPPVPEELRYSGRPLVHLVAATDAESTHWIVRLEEATSAPEDPLAPNDEGLSNVGYLHTRHRHGVAHPRDLTPGETYEAALRMYPKEDVIEQGHRLRVVLNNNDPNVRQDTTFATSVVHLGPEGSHLLLPLAPAGRPVPEDALRAEEDAPR